MKRERLNEIDILRGIAFIFVVVQHTLGGFSNIKGLPYSSYTVMKIMYVMGKPAVPMFLFISAVALFYVSFNNFDWKKYYAKRIKYILIPYVIWSAINMIKLGNEERFKDFIVQVIAGNGAFHLWYMGMALGLYLIFPILLWIAKRIHSLDIKIRTSLFVLLLCLYYQISKYQSVISDNTARFIFGTPTEVQQRIINISILFWFIYFVLGVYLALNYGYIKKKLVEFKVGIYGAYGLLFIYAYLNEINKVKYVRILSLLYMIVSILAFYLISVKLVEKVKVYKAMKFIGDYSFASYMAHVIVINYVANDIMIRFNTRNYLIVGVLTLIITVVVTPVFIKLISFIPFSEYITGSKVSRKKFTIKEEYSKTA